MSFKEFFLLLSFVQGLLLFFSLFGIDRKNITNRLLAFHSLVWGTMCYYRYTVFQDVDYILEHHYVLKFGSVVFMTFFVFIFLYVKYMCTREKKIKCNDFLHFLPALLVFCFYFRFFTLTGPEKINIALSHRDIYYSVVARIIDYVAVVQGLFYFYYSIKYIRLYHIRIREDYSNIDRLTLNWLRYMVIIVFSISLLGSIGDQLYSFRLISDVYFDFQFFIIGGSLFLVSYYLLTEHELFYSNRPKRDILFQNKTEQNVVFLNEAKSVDKDLPHLDMEYCRKVVSKLTWAMEKDKLYLNQDLSLNEVAEKIDIPRHHISVVLNKILDKTFFDYINKYRVEEVKKRLQDTSSKNLTLLAIAFDAGFNSKATFNRIFKKYENMTPLEYRNSLPPLC